MAAKWLRRQRIVARPRPKAGVQGRSQPGSMQAATMSPHKDYKCNASGRP